MGGANMDLKEIYSNLCDYDNRTESYQDLRLIYDEDEIKEPRKGCHCDNCFYGRDKLALEILRLRG